MSLPRHGVLPMFNITGYHLTRHPYSIGQWDLRVEASNGDALTVEGISVAEGQAFITCLERAILHTAPEQPTGTMSPDEIRRTENLKGPQPEPPADPDAGSSLPLGDPPPTGPAGDAQLPLATGGVISAPDWFRLGGKVATNPNWNASTPAQPWARTAGQQYELHYDHVPVGGSSVTVNLGATPAAGCAVLPRFVHVQPGEQISVWCTCGTVTGGLRADNPKCEVHHGQPTVYLFDAT